MANRRCIVLLSGGMDSCVVAALALAEGYTVTAISFAYGQKHQVELESATAVARALGVEQQVVEIPRLFSGSALTDPAVPLPLDRSLHDLTGIAPSYVPARNTVFLALAGAVADARNIPEVHYGAHREDHVGYPDTRPEYFEAMSQALTLGTQTPVRVVAPFIRQSKADIVRVGHDLGAPLELTLSCYQGQIPACGRCDTCHIRIDAFRQAGFMDPIAYAGTVDWTGCVPFGRAV